MPPRLMIPGPVELEPEVLAVMSQPILAHYGDAWVSIHNETIDLLKQVFGSHDRVFMLPGSGNLAVDSAAQSAFAPGETVIVGNNGWFGERMIEIMRANRIHLIEVKGELCMPLSVDAIAQALDAHPEAAGVAVVHVETSTGILNPVREIAALVRDRENCLMMIDAVTGLAGTDLAVDAWNIDLCASASQKALGAPPGLALVSVSEKAWAKMAARPDQPHSWYLDLRRWQWHAENWADWHPFPVTMPTPAVLALREALRSLMREGLSNRQTRYRQMAQQLRNGLASMQINLFAPSEFMSSIITAAYSPTPFTSTAIKDHLLTHQNIQIASGFGPYKEHVFRVGHMGGAINCGDIERLLSGLQELLGK
jgi:alanine-glyoxylate transaminase / serine-glyoxylate transaminase / serine-pyruvate transaminase